MHQPSFLHVERALWVALALATIPVGIPGPADPTSGRQGGARIDRGDEGKDRSGSLSDLERDLRAPRPETRRSAVRQLAVLGARKAWDLVVRALSDADPMVADEAQVALGSLADRDLAAELLGPAGLRASDDWVRLRVAEAFGRMPIEVDAEALARGIVHGDPRAAETDRAILWSIERLARVKRLAGDALKAYRAAERIARSRGEAGMRGAALQAMNAIDPLEARATVAEWLEEKDGALRCAALLAVSTWTEQECLSTTERLIDDPDARVRAQAIENLEAQSSRAAMLALVRRMEIEPRGRLKWGIRAYLRARSGEDHGFDGEAWRGWARTIEGRLATGEGRGTRLGPMGGTNASFAGMDLVSDRVCF
jgi:HEAT repeat protein